MSQRKNIFRGIRFHFELFIIREKQIRREKQTFIMMIPVLKRAEYFFGLVCISQNLPEGR